MVQTTLTIQYPVISLFLFIHFRQFKNIINKNYFNNNNKQKKIKTKKKPIFLCGHSVQKMKFFALKVKLDRK